MTSLRIAEVSERTGVPATTLRYYDEIGLLSPADRRANGYRAYSERDVERLLFLTRAKRLDLTLDDLRLLLEAWDGDCSGTQQRMAALVRRRLAETQDRLADLGALAAQLQTAAARLDVPAQDGRCDAGCACETALAPEPIACSLTAAAAQGRLEQWRAVLARSTGGRAVPGGREVDFTIGPEAGDAALVADLGRLAAAEASCCRFFEFALAVSADRVRLRVTGPPEVADLITAIFR